MTTDARNIDTALSVFSLIADWEAAQRCTGRARDFFVSRHLRRGHALAAGGGLNGWRCSRRDDSIVLMPKWPESVIKRFGFAPEWIVTDIAFEGEYLSDFTLAGWPLSDRLRFLGCSTNGRVVAWAEKHPIPPTFSELGILQILFIDTETARAIPQTFALRLSGMDVEGDSGLITTSSESCVMTAVSSSVLNLGRGRFIGEMHPEHPVPRTSSNDPPSVWKPDPNPGEVMTFEARRRRDDTEPWFRFDAADDLSRATDLIGFAPLVDGSRSDAVVDHWTEDPHASKLRTRIKKITAEYEALSTSELRARVAAGVVLLREIERLEPAAMAKTNRETTLSTVAQVAATSSFDEINTILDRPEATTT